MRPKDFRFAIGPRPRRSRAAWQQVARQAEDLGFDVLLVSDHIGIPSPLLALASAAEATTIKLGTFVLNAGFYKPILLARDVAGMRTLTDGRFELGLGAGWLREEFEAAELAFAGGGARVDHLARITSYLRQQITDVPILIAGTGDRLLTLAAQQADTIAIAAGTPLTASANRFSERLDFVRHVAGDRFAELELNLAITAVPHNAGGTPDLALSRRYSPQLSDEQLRKLPSVLCGSPRHIADTLREHRDTFGLTYFTVQEHHAAYFSKVIAELR